jgi:hypothetical protein
MLRAYLRIYNTKKSTKKFQKAAKIPWKGREASETSIAQKGEETPFHPPVELSCRGVCFSI